MNYELEARWITGHEIVLGWTAFGDAQRVVDAKQAEAMLRKMGDEIERLRAALERVKYKAASLADAKVIALEALV